MTRAEIDAFVDRLAAATGLDRRVVAAWVRAEGAYTSGGTGGYNFLNVRARAGGKGYSGVAISRSSGGFAKFGSLDAAVRETSFWINRMPNYAGIRSSVDKGPAAQLAAIARSPWDANNYAGGRGLTKNYAAVNKGDGGFDWGGLAGDVALGATGIPGRVVKAALEGDPSELVPGFGDIPGTDTSPAGLLGKALGLPGINNVTEAIGRLVLAVVVLGLAAALFYNGVRRLSGDRLPSTSDMAMLAATRGASKAA